MRILRISINVQDEEKAGSESLVAWHVKHLEVPVSEGTVVARFEIRASCDLLTDNLNFCIIEEIKSKSPF